MGNRIPKTGKRFAPEVGRKFAAFYRQTYPKNTAKLLAQEAGCSVDTAKNWLSGSCPANEHLFAAWARRGRAFFAFVFDDIDADLARIAQLKAEVDEINKRIHRVTEALKEHEQQID